MTNLLQSLSELLTSFDLTFLTLLACAPLFAGCCGGCGHCGGHNDEDGDAQPEEDENDVDDEEDEDDEDATADFNLGFSKEDLDDYNDHLKQTNERINELVEDLDGEPDGTRKDKEEELVKLYLHRAALLQEEGETDEALNNYNAAFERLNEYVESYGESRDTLQTLADGRLGLGILYNEESRFSDADEEYERAGAAYEKLVALGSKQAKLDLIGVSINRAGVAFAQRRRSDSLNMLDEASENLEKLAETSGSDAEVLYYLGKVHSLKAEFLREELEEEDLESPDALEALENRKKASQYYRVLVASGNDNYRQEFAECLVELARTTPNREKNDLTDSINVLAEACQAYERVLHSAKMANDAEGLSVFPDLLDATMLRGELLTRAERTKEAASLYDGVIDIFGSFESSDEWPLLENLALAYQNRAILRKETAKVDTRINDLSKAIELQSRIADVLINTLKERGDEEEDSCKCGCGCGCGPDCDCGCQEGKECACKHDGKDGSCKCGCGCSSDCDCGCQEGKECTCKHDDKDGSCKCGCGCSSDCQCGCQEGKECACKHDDKDGSCKCGCEDCDDEDECGCGCGCCGEEERKFLIKRWVNSNFRSLTQSLWERAQAYQEKKDTSSAIHDCMLAETIEKAYRSVLREGETLDDEFSRELREFRRWF